MRYLFAKCFRSKSVLLLFDEEDLDTNKSCLHFTSLKVRTYKAFALIEFATLITLFIMQSLLESKNFNARAPRCKKQFSHAEFGITS